MPRIPRPSVSDLRDIDVGELEDGSILIWSSEKRKWVTTVIDLN
jgi:hypothetical protein